jgi:hypothetical protein
MHCSSWLAHRSQHWRASRALGLARHLTHKDTHLPQGVRSTGDEKERLGAGCLPPLHLVDTLRTGADHVVGVWVVKGSPGRLHDTYASWPWDVAGAADAGQLFGVL